MCTGILWCTVLKKLQKRFGLDIRTFEDALAFKLAMMVSDYITYSGNHGK